MSTPATCGNLGLTAVETVIRGGFVPDESEVVFDEGVGCVDGQMLQILCHSSFTLVAIDRGGGWVYVKAQGCVK